MIFSSQKKLLFIHIPKTGGTSIQEALKTMDDLPKNYKIRTKHETLDQFNNRTGIDISGFTVFAVTRHPYERFVSFFHYLAKFEKRSGKKIVNLTTPDGLVQSLRDKDKELMQTHTIKPQYQYLTHSQKLTKRTTLRIFKYENLERDFQKLCEELEMNVKLPRLNASVEHDYRTELNSESRKYLYDYYERDFENFGYDP